MPAKAVAFMPHVRPAWVLNSRLHTRREVVTLWQMPPSQLRVRRATAPATEQPFRGSGALRQWTLTQADLTLRRPAGPSRRVGYIVFVAILRDAALRAAPQDEVICGSLFNERRH